MLEPNENEKELVRIAVEHCNALADLHIEIQAMEKQLGGAKSLEKQLRKIRDKVAYLLDHIFTQVVLKYYVCKDGHTSVQYFNYDDLNDGS